MSKQKKQGVSSMRNQKKTSKKYKDLPKGFGKELAKHLAKIDRDIKSGRAAARVKKQVEEEKRQEMERRNEEMEKRNAKRKLDSKARAVKARKGMK